MGDALTKAFFKNIYSVKKNNYAKFTYIKFVQFVKFNLTLHYGRFIGLKRLQKYIYLFIGNNILICMNLHYYK